MRRVKHVILIGLSMFVANSSVAWASPPLSKSEAGRVVKKFCEKVVVTKPVTNNATDPADRPDIYRQVVTSDVAGLYGRAVARSKEVQAATGGKPEMGDGVWTSMQDAASGCLLGSISGTRNRPEVEIRYVLVGETKPSVTDALVLKKERGEWRVDDIRYSNGGKRGLRSRLASAISESIPASQ